MRAPTGSGCSSPSGSIWMDMSPRASMAAAAMVMFAAAVPLAAIDADRDFSGRWFLDPQAGNIRTLSALPDRLLAVVQRGMELRCTAAAEDGAETAWNFTADGKESQYPLGDERRTAFAKWEGSALLVTTIVSGPSNYSIQDRWKLSADRKAMRTL